MHLTFQNACWIHALTTELVSRSTTGLSARVLKASQVGELKLLRNRFRKGLQSLLQGRTVRRTLTSVLALPALGSERVKMV